MYVKWTVTSSSLSMSVGFFVMFIHYKTIPKKLFLNKFSEGKGIESWKSRTEF